MTAYLLPAIPLLNKLPVGAEEFYAVLDPVHGPLGEVLADALDDPFTKGRSSPDQPPRGDHAGSKPWRQHGRGGAT